MTIHIELSETEGNALECALARWIHDYEKEIEEEHEAALEDWRQMAELLRAGQRVLERVKTLRSMDREIVKEEPTGSPVKKCPAHQWAHLFLEPPASLEDMSRQYHFRFYWKDSGYSFPPRKDVRVCSRCGAVGSAARRKRGGVREEYARAWRSWSGGDLNRLKALAEEWNRKVTEGESL